VTSSPENFTRDLIRWSETLAAIARTGMGFTQSLYEKERYEEVLKVAADIKASAQESIEVRREQDHFVQEWMQAIGEGVPGYITPKIAIGCIVGNDNGEMLLVQRPEHRIWLYPTGWADVGYSASEVAVKEVEEETGIIAEPVQLLGVVDGMRMGFSRFGMYMLIFHMRAVGGTLQGHPLETADVGWFAENALPEATAGIEWWGSMAFSAIRGEPQSPTFDVPRPEMWRGQSH
jgi:ADP-ribose pyrophosphatase YjhB (NUDIX family)